VLKLFVSSGIKPVKVRASIAKSSTKDFHDTKYENLKMKKENSIYIDTLEEPSADYAAIFGAAIYSSGELPYTLSTNAYMMK